MIGAASASKLDVVRSLGADLTIGYDEIGSGFNVVLESVGGDVYKAALRGLAPMDRLVIVGAAGAFPKGGRWRARLGELRHIPRVSVFDMLRRSYGVMSFHVGQVGNGGDGGRMRGVMRGDVWDIATCTGAVPADACVLTGSGSGAPWREFVAGACEGVMLRGACAWRPAGRSGGGSFHTSRTNSHRGHATP